MEVHRLLDGQHLAQDFPDYTTLNRGFGGSTLLQCFQQFKRIIYPLEPSVLVLYAGENDIGGGASTYNCSKYFSATYSNNSSFLSELTYCLYFN